ncbi:MAG: hypothetical protein DRJ31_09375 [Candidatus Methanomethylicota archaeon]|uniref:Uncharacterized protein n=1 Tax=Thermoproteota archaeon TaxID=2056631 RepID=A0A497EKR1_9CREN|nr:MAG: hypothetical protein DRJ31_09375 [Candidatus Verstraetearchaeota archaeon]
MHQIEDRLSRIEERLSRIEERVKKLEKKPLRLSLAEKFQIHDRSMDLKRYFECELCHLIPEHVGVVKLREEVRVIVEKLCELLDMALGVRPLKL